MTAPVRVHQVIDGATFRVSVTFEPARVIINGKHGIEILLTPIEAGLLDHELCIAASPPDSCDYPDCSRYAVVTTGVLNLCSQCHHRAEVEANMAAGVEP